MISKKLFFFSFLLCSITTFVQPADVERSESPAPLNIATFLEGESSPAPSPKTSPKGSAQSSPRPQQSPRNLQPVDLGTILGESHEGKEAPRAPSPVAVAVVVFANQADSAVVPLSTNSRIAELEDQARQINRTEGNSKAETKQKKEEATTKHQQQLAALIRQKEEIRAQIKSEETQHAQTITTLDEAQKAADAASFAELEALRLQRHTGWWFTRSWTPLVPDSPKSAQ